MKYYVYQHTRNDTGEVFYIGKGCGNRAWKFGRSGRRSKQWSRIADKHGVSVSILMYGLTHSAALNVESQLISKIGRRDLKLGPLVNGTDGGEGARGLLIKHTEDSKRKISIKALGNQRTKGMKFNAIIRDKFSISQRQRPPRSDNKTGFKGVSIYSLRNCYTAKINICGKVKTIGYYDQPELAAKAYDDYAISVWGEGNCYLNLPHLR